MVSALFIGIFLLLHPFRRRGAGYQSTGSKSTKTFFFPPSHDFYTGASVHVQYITKVATEVTRIGVFCDPAGTLLALFVRHGRTACLEIERERLVKLETLREKLSSSTLEDEAIEIEHDNSSEEIEKDYGSTYASSLFTEVMKHRFESGRRYGAGTENLDKYWGPNDAKAQESYDLLHHVYYIVRKKRLHSAPLKDPKRILDLGTGTGIYASDMAELFPEAEVFGTDLSALQPPWHPPNVRYLVGNEYDITQDWKFPKDHFDFVHARTMMGSFSWQQWPEVFQRAYDHLKPGGWFEVVDTSPAATSDDGSVDNTTPARLVGLACSEAGAKIGRPLLVMEHFKPWMEGAGFVDIAVEKRRMPLGTWPRNKELKLAGKCLCVTMKEGFDTFMGRMLSGVLGMTEEEVAAAREKYFAAMRDRTIHAFYQTYIVYGRKPLSS